MSAGTPIPTRFYLSKVIKKSRIFGTYCPRRYSSVTVCRVFKNDIFLNDVIASNYGGFKKVVELYNNKYKEPDYLIEVNHKAETVYT